jgi:RNA polymerase sigma-70 factor (ECF subfamily)
VDESLRREMISFLPRLRRFAYGLTGSIADGDDLLQATYERAIRHIDQWQAGTRLDSWMYRIARNLHLNAIRANGLRGEQVAANDIEQQAVVDGERVMDSQLTFESVRRFVRALPDEQRTILLLVCVEGFSYKEVAAMLELPMGTVTSRLARARIALKEQLDGKGRSAAPQVKRKTP